MKTNRDKRLGNWGEAWTAHYLYSHGYTILEHQYATRLGELDLVARTGDTLAVVEVKVRSGDFELGAEAVTTRKQGRVKKALGKYLMEHPEYRNLYVRYDVCQITGDMETQRPRLEYFENAFY